MNTVGQRERAVQNRVINLFINALGYSYLGDWHDRTENANIEEGLLKSFLTRQGVSPALIDRAMYEINRVVGNQANSLYDVNKAFYSLLRYGVPMQEDVGDLHQSVKLIDWDHPLENDFAIAEEVTISGEHNKRPDLVLYVNGIALGTLELKRSIVSVSEGIRQNLDNQKPIFIKPFFHTIQLVMAGNDTQGLRYGVIETPEKYYLTWKEANPQPDLPPIKLDQHLTQLCDKSRFLEIIHDFMVFDFGTKKICRHSQYYAVKAAQNRARQREGGVIWHTQGSGKSLIMVWLAKWIREHIENSRVLIITDRTELDEQIEGVFLGVGEAMHRCTSGHDLVDKLNAALPPLLCSLIHKFGTQEEADYKGFIEDITRALPKDFQAKGDIYVFIDECHRTQSGQLHDAMKKIIPDAMFIGFTGTPLLKTDKQKSIEVFGPYIHTYKYDEAVKDGVVLDLRYEARDINQDITSQEKIDLWFDSKTKGLTDLALMQLKKRWGTIQTIYSSRSRLEKIVADILLDMETKDRLKSGRGNALLIAGSIYEACKFYEIFLEHGFDKCAIITSYQAGVSDITGEESGEGDTENIQKYEIYQQMLGGRGVEAFEKKAKEQFIKEPGQMKLLIVVDKLLTGFDAPPATYLYIDKHMQDHGLFQAICRVNRLDGEDKEYGYIVDYKDLFKSLEQSVHDYTSGAFEGYDKEDVQGLLSNRLEKAKERLDDKRETVKSLCEPVPHPKSSVAYIHYFCGQDSSNIDELKENQQKRLALYQETASLIRAYANLANEMEQAGYTVSDIETIKNEVTYYEKVRTEIKLASGDYIDLKLYEPAMRHLIDNYIKADESEKLSAFNDLALIKLIVERGEGAISALPREIQKDHEAVAETIENNVRKLIINEQPVNPKYYEKMSTLLDELIRQRKLQVIAYEQYLAKIVELTRLVDNPAESETYPGSLDTGAKRALFDNLGKDEALALILDQEIRSTKKDAWRGNKIKEREVRFAIRRHIPDARVDEIFELVKNQNDY